MASKCGCAGNSCSCKVIAGRGARVRGTGAQNNPIVIDALPMSLAEQDSTTVNITITGTGSVADPWKIRADVSATLMADKWGFWVGTQAEYDALLAWDDHTLYGITGP